MLSAFSNSMKIPELRSRILFTFLMIAACRVFAAIPIPGVNLTNLEAARQRSGGDEGGFLSLLNLFTGGALENFAVGAMGIMPYISASIILQLMQAVVPHLEKLKREGEAGQQKITQYTRYLTILICVVQGFFMTLGFLNPERLGLPPGSNIVVNGGLSFQLTAVLVMTTSTMILMWLGEQITDRGIGNGISLVITVSIIATLPQAVVVAKGLFFPGGNNPAQFSIFHLVALLAMFFFVTMATVLLTQGVRKITVQHAKRQVGRKQYSGGQTHLPLRVNYSGVMPIIFAQAILMFPGMFLAFIDAPWANKLQTYLGMGHPFYITVYSAMILFFSYFWVATQFKPLDMADDLKRNGGYVPGIRPGKPTADFLDRTMTRITLAGAVFLTLLAVLPIFMSTKFGIPFVIAQFFGGTSLLIIVGVMLDTMRQIESHLLNRHYDGFLRKGKMRR